ncbi:MAG: ABC transporter permease [Bryobacteraceae bacterium]
MPDTWMRIRELIDRTRLDGELDEEVDLHLQMMEEEFRRRGMSEAEAKAAARREFGGVAQAKEAYRDQRGFPWLESFAKDVRYALRGLRRSPGFTAAAVASLALGIGANTAIFSLFHTLMLRMLQVEHAEQLISIHSTGGWGTGNVSVPLYREIAGRADLFNGVIATTGASKVRFTPYPGGREEYTQREYVSGNYFQVLGIRPAIGRLFTGEDNRVPGGHPLAVLGYDLWRNHFGADPGVLGRTVLVDEQALTVIGVAAPGFGGVELERRTDVWVPFLMSHFGQVMSPHSWWLSPMARMRPEAPRRRTQAALDVLMQQHLSALYGGNRNAGFREKAMGQRLEIRRGSVGLSLLREHFGKPRTGAFGGGEQPAAFTAGGPGLGHDQRPEAAGPRVSDAGHVALPFGPRYNSGFITEKEISHGPESKNLCRRSRSGSAGGPDALHSQQTVFGIRLLVGRQFPECPMGATRVRPRCGSAYCLVA